jgi:hypothetical protein
MMPMGRLVTEDGKSRVFLRRWTKANKVKAQWMFEEKGHVIRSMYRKDWVMEIH